MNSFITASDQITLRTLSEATEALQIKTEVQSVLNSIITDIETTHELETKLNHEYEVQRWQQRAEHAERALEEYKLVEKEKKDHARVLVEHFVDEIGGLTGFMRELKLERTKVLTGGEKNGEEKEVHEQYDGAVFMPIEEDVEADHEAQSPNENALLHQGETKESEETSLNVDETPLQEQDNASKESKSSNIEKQSPPSTVQHDNDGPIQSSESPVGRNEASTALPVTTAPKTKTIITKQKVKKIIQQPKKIKRRLPPTLHSINSTTLMKIFEFMDAIDIVNVAQTNVRMYSKVDSIFGLGGAGLETDGRDGGEDEEYEEVWIDEDVEVEVEEDVEVEIPVEENEENEDGDDRGNATIVSIPPPASNSSTTASSSKPTKVDIPTKKSSSNSSIHEMSKVEKASSSSSSSSSSSKPTTSLSSTKAQSSTNPSSSSTASSTSSSRNNNNSAPPEGFQISSAVAAALADKLSPIELSAIITMRDQLRIREQETIQMKEELNTLAATLDGTLSVKEVLSVKVKEQQLALEQKNEISEKMNRQSLSDQEVIAFLDERVQDLERQVGNFDKERLAKIQEMDVVKKSSEKQLAVLGDMLTFEREQMADHEKEWKSTKKVLVKEVKHLRAQILAVEAERDGYYEENMKLKEALMSVGSSSKSAKSFDYS